MKVISDGMPQFECKSDINGSSRNETMMSHPIGIYELGDQIKEETAVRWLIVRKMTNQIFRNFAHLTYNS